MTSNSEKSDESSVVSDGTSQKTWTQILSRGVIGIACLSVASMCVIILLVWICVAHGDCLHHGPDLCASRKPGVPSDEGPPGRVHDGEPPVGFVGNADVYGLGIRLGIYCQWFSSIIANALLDEHARRVTTVPYVGFQLAMLAALLYLVFRSDCTFTAEVFVLLYILLGGVFVVLAPELVQSFRHVRWKAKNQPRYRLFNTLVWILLGWVVPVSAWFWIRLADADDRPDFMHTPGGTSMFLVARVEQSQFRTASVFMAVWSILLGLFAIEKIVLACVYRALEVELRPAPLMILDTLFSGIHKVHTRLRTAITNGIVSYANDPSKPLGEHINDSLHSSSQISLIDTSAEFKHQSSERATRLYALALAGFNVTMSICAVELTLAWNHVSSISSLAATGQIIALFVGMSTLVSVFWDLSKRSYGQRPHISSVSERESLAAYDAEAYMWQLGDADKSKQC